jgi:hypothetical protein
VGTRRAGIRVDEALAAAREGIEHGRSGGCIYYEASAQIALARILLATDGAAAHVNIADALNRAEELVAMVDGTRHPRRFRRQSRGSSGGCRRCRRF